MLMVFVIVQVVIVENYVPIRMVNIFSSNNYSIIYIFLFMFFIKMLIYVKEFIVKIMEHVLFEIITDHMKVFVSVDMVPGEIIVN